jgi:hypothetical protein
MLLLHPGIPVPGILPLIDRERGGRRNRSAIPPVPSASTLFPSTSPVLTPAGRRIGLPTAKVHRRLPVVTHRDTQNKQRHNSRVYKSPGPVVPGTRIPASSSSKVCALLELATPRHRNAPPLMRLVCLPRFLPSDDVFTPIGLACAPYAVGRCECRSTIDVDFGVLTPSPSTTSNDVVGIPPQASTPLQSFTRAPRRSSVSRPANRPTNALPAPSEVSRPFSVFPAGRSHLAPAVSQPTGCVAPSGFRTLSTLCSPLGLPGLFHPGPALGVHSSRPCSSRDAVRRSRRRAPPGVPTGSEEPIRPSRGSAHHAKPAHDAQGLARPSCRMPPRASSPPRFLASGGGGPVSPPYPLTCFLGSAFTLTSPPAPQGVCRRRRSRSLSRSARPPWSSLPRWSSRRFGSAVELGYGFPSEAAPVTRRPAFLFALPSRFLPEPSEKTVSVTTRS